MSVWQRVRNAVQALVSPTVDLGSEELLEWLGIQQGTNKALLGEVTYYTCLLYTSDAADD